jgi:Uma2 family endonuclease
MTEPRKATYEEYLALSHEGLRAEWVNEEIIEDMPPFDVHQRLLVFLSTLIDLFSRLNNIGVVRVAPLELRLRPDGNSREPDLMFIANEHLNRVTEQRVEGAPDLIVEIVSNESVHRDRVDKLDEYESGGVAEYWILDNRPGRNRAQFHQLSESGRYVAVEPDSEGVYHSRVLPGLWLNVDWLWEAQPNALKALAIVVGPDQMADAMRRAVSG